VRLCSIGSSLRCATIKRKTTHSWSTFTEAEVAAQTTGNRSTAATDILIDFFTGDQTQEHYPSFVVAPQSPSEGWIKDDSLTPTRYLQLVQELIGELQRTHKIDEARIYVAGQSMGGFGAFAIISGCPRTFAAGVALCGGGDKSKVSRLTNVPIWVFHGAKDESVPVERSRTIVTAINKAGGKVRYTEYPDIGHIIWPSVVKETELLPWLFAQRR